MSPSASIDGPGSARAVQAAPSELKEQAASQPPPRPALESSAAPANPALETPAAQAIDTRAVADGSQGSSQAADAPPEQVEDSGSGSGFIDTLSKRIRVAASGVGEGLADAGGTILNGIAWAAKKAQPAGCAPPPAESPQAPGDGPLQVRVNPIAMQRPDGSTYSTRDAIMGALQRAQNTLKQADITLVDRNGGELTAEDIVLADQPAEVDLQDGLSNGNVVGEEPSPTLAATSEAEALLKGAKDNDPQVIDLVFVGNLYENHEQKLAGTSFPESLYGNESDISGTAIVGQSGTRGTAHTVAHELTHLLLNSPPPPPDDHDVPLGNLMSVEESLAQRGDELNASQIWRMRSQSRYTEPR